MPELDFKLDEARYFLSEIDRCYDDHRLVKYNLSAFLSAARSVLQYACIQALNVEGGATWYQQQIEGHLVVKFFKEERDSNVHEESVKPGQKLWDSLDGITTSYGLSRWTLGEEDVRTLADQYLADLRVIVADGRARGFLT